MQKLQTTISRNYRTELENVGVLWHHTEENSNYWSEDSFYQFSLKEIDVIEKATNDLHDMFLKAGQRIIDKNLFKKFGIPDWVVPHIKKSWEEEPPALFYGRFDLGYDGMNPPKLFEYNCDTPTSLLEASVAQWQWKEHYFPDLDQFNSIHEKLIAKWNQLKVYLPGNNYMAYANDPVGEDLMTVTYLQDTANQAGIDFDLIVMGDIGWDSKRKQFVDMDERTIDNIFKLYPWEWLINEEFAKYIFEHSMFANPRTLWMEPIWKMMWSNKAILPILWEMYPNHPNLLPAFFEAKGNSYVKKPILAREGANVSIVKDGKTIQETLGEYGEEGFIYQEIFNVPEFNGKYPVIGSWIIDGQSAGMGIRDGNIITNNQATFVPHVIKD